MNWLGLMNKIFNPELFVVLINIFYKLDSLFISFYFHVFYIYTQNKFLSKKNPNRFSQLQVRMLLLYMRWFYAARICEILVFASKVEGVLYAKGLYTPDFTVH